ncbi:hypothetical protein ColLi_02060 [Colletotrichum liriopes]|uniref:Uncharacterized protein n=1 Tax=Colletotrichum liriopes TaxID=708192 RepID=A0AA37GEJ3_9PEZI|nr:hypothetical protein ColLi_02060 [Colletotrichum liriopes]
MEPVTPVVGEAKVPEVGQEPTKAVTYSSKALSLICTVSYSTLALVAGVDRTGQKADKPTLPAWPGCRTQGQLLFPVFRLLA